MAPDPALLPLPKSALGQRVADLALGDRQNRLNAGELAARPASSVLSVSPLIAAEAGLTLKAWRQRSRIIQAMDLLARETAIAHASAEFGFASTA